MNTPDILAATTPIVDALEQLGITYHIGGSVASSLHGIPRLTLDIDIIADLRRGQVRAFVQRLQADYYIDEDAVRDAIRHRSLFNAIHLGTLLKVDIYIPKSRSFDQEGLRRVRPKVLEGNTRPFLVASAEDTILNKLEWYRMGGEVSDRQWNDILGVLKVQEATLDMAYLEKWAIELKVEDLLVRALMDAGS
jgi:hypothetical protein